MQEDKEKSAFIPRTVEAYDPQVGVSDEQTDYHNLMFEPLDGELIHVLLWERYPSYDMIFGVPEKTSKRYEKEVGFFMVRRVGDAVHTGHYFDIKESQAMVEGFDMILKASFEHSKHLWEKHQK